MSVPGPDPIDRTIDEVLASMLEGEPVQVTGASVRRAAGSPSRPALPVWLAAAAVVIVLLGVALREERPAPAPLIAGATPLPLAPADPAATPTPQTARAARMAATPRPRATTTEPVYEGLPRLEVASIDIPTLDTTRMGSDPIRIDVIDIPPLTVSGLTNQQDNK